MNDRFKTSAAKRYFAGLVSWAASGWLLLFLTLARGQDAATWRVLIEPTFMNPPVSQPIPGAKKTVLVAAYESSEGELAYFSKDAFAKLRLKWPDFAARSTQNAKARELKTELVRDKKDVVQYARLFSENPLTATAALSPDFAAKLVDIFGERPLVVVPNRYTIFVFPRLASNYQDYAPMMIEAYRATPYPVSLEVFEADSSGLKAVGSYTLP